MDILQLKQFSSLSDLPNDYYRALWLDMQGDWHAAHRIVQALSDTNAMWIHAYLHRKEPDIENARYWYRNAGKPYPGGQSLEEEAAHILGSLGS